MGKAKIQYPSPLIAIWLMNKNYLAISLMALFMSACCGVYVPEKLWEARVVAEGYTSDNKPIKLLRRGVGFECTAGGGHNPCITLDIWPRKYDIDIVSEGKVLTTFPMPFGKGTALSIIDESRLIAIPSNYVAGSFGNKQIYEYDVKTKESKLLAGISYRYDSTPGAEKADLIISNRGKYAAWAEPTGLGIINLETGVEKKILEGLPVRSHAFSADATSVAFDIWLDTTAVQSNKHNIDIETLRECSISHRVYDRSTRNSVETGKTTEYVGRVVFDLRAWRVISTSRGQIVNCESYRGSFTPYRYRNSPF